MDAPCSPARPPTDERDGAGAQNTSGGGPRLKVRYAARDGTIEVLEGQEGEIAAAERLFGRPLPSRAFTTTGRLAPSWTVTVKQAPPSTGTTPPRPPDDNGPTVVISVDEDGDPVEAVRRQDGALAYVRTNYSKDGEKRAYSVTTVLIPRSFEPTVRTDESGERWVDWAAGPDGPVRAPIREFTDALCRRYAIRGPSAHALSLWLDNLPPVGPVATRLALYPPDSRHVNWSVPSSIYTRENGLARSPNSIVASWYRPRPKDFALEQLRELLTFARTLNQRAVLAFLAGAPVAAKIAPNRPRAYTEEVGESNTGKTEWARAGIAVLWGLGGRPKEFLDLSALTSEFRWEAWFATTDLPLLVDESLLDLAQRRRLRRAVSGGLGSRGRRDQLVYTLPHTAAVLLTTNVEVSELDSAPSERHGDARRRLRLVYGREDRAALTPQRLEAFHTFQRGLSEGPVDPDGGGAALWMLRDLELRDPGLTTLKALDTGDRSDVQFVLDVGAAMLGLDRITLQEGDEPEAEDAFVDWVRQAAARWVQVTNSRDQHGNLRRPDDPLIPMLSVRTTDGKTEATRLEDAELVLVTATALRAYEVETRRGGRTSPWSKLPQLRALSAVTGQPEDEICGLTRGHLRWLSGKRERVAVLRPWAFAGSSLDPGGPVRLTGPPPPEMPPSPSTPNSAPNAPPPRVDSREEDSVRPALDLADRARADRQTEDARQAVEKGAEARKGLSWALRLRNSFTLGEAEQMGAGLGMKREQVERILEGLRTAGELKGPPTGPYHWGGHGRSP